MDDLGITWDEPETPEPNAEEEASSEHDPDDEGDEDFEDEETGEEGCEESECEDDPIVEETPSTEFPPPTAAPSPAGPMDLAEQPEPKPIVPDSVCQAEKNNEVVNTPPPKGLQPPAVTPEAVIVSCFPFNCYIRFL